jgi:hypothetical protein
MVHRTIRWANGATAIYAQRSTLPNEQCIYSVASEVRAGSQRGTGLSGVAPDCPVPQEYKAPMVKFAQNPNGWVTWRRTGQGTVPVRWRTAHRTVRCAHREQPPQRLWKWLGAINTPQPPHSYPSKHSKHLIQYKSKRLHSKTHQIHWILSKPPNSLNSIRDLREGVFVFFVDLVAWLGLFLFNSYSQVLCKRSRRHISVWWSLRSLSDPID